MRRQILYHCATREALHGYLVVSFLSHGKMWSKKRGLWDALSLQTVILPLLKLPRIFKKREDKGNTVSPSVMTKARRLSTAISPPCTQSGTRDLALGPQQS